MNEQLSLFGDISPDLKPGDYVEMHGRELSFDEIRHKVGQMIVYDCSTESHAWFKMVLVERILTDPENGERRLIYFDGGKQRGSVSEIFFRPRYKGQFPARAYELC